MSPSGLPGFGGPRPPRAERRKNGRWDLKLLGVKRRRHVVLFDAAVLMAALLIIVSLVALYFWQSIPDPHAGAPGLGELWFGDSKVGAVGLPDPERMVKPGEMLLGILAAIGVGIGLVQWRDARREASLEKYYERLDLANRRMEAIYEARSSKEGGPVYRPGRGPTQRDVLDVLHRGIPPEAMWIFTELDNLEYVLVKYELGFASCHMVCRALDNFASKCESVPHFARSATALVGREVGAGFQAVTQNVVSAMARDVVYKGAGTPRALVAHEGDPEAAMPGAGEGPITTSTALAGAERAGVA